MSMTDFFYTYGNILMLGFQIVLFFSLVYLAKQFMCIFIKPLYIWIEDVKKRKEYSEAKRNDKILLNKTAKVSHSDETILQSADEVIQELTTYFDNNTNTTTTTDMDMNTDMDQVE